MPKKVAADTGVRILEEIGHHADGIGIETLHAQLADAISRRTLQRRLAQFVSEGKLVTTGKRRGFRYRLAPLIDEVGGVLPGVTDKISAESYVPLSPEGQEIKDQVRRPRRIRTPVSYNQDFLEAYYPNKTAYLPTDLRDQLRKIGTPPDGDQTAGTFARDIMNRLLIDLSWASSRLEGNTYSRLDTERLIEFGQVADGKDALETQMILNHKAAIELLLNEADLVDFTPYTICSLHALLSDGLLQDSSACGRVRRRPVEIGGSVYRPIAIPQRIEELFEIIISMAREIRDPFEQAFFAMVHLPYLQPFEEVNKRVSRLAANISLVRHNLCPLSFIDVPERAYIDAVLGVYELNRIDLLRDMFVWAYDRSCQHYLAVRRQLVPPDTFRLRYRQALSEIVKAIVVHLQSPTRERITAAIPSSVAPVDRDKFVHLVLDEFENLYEGNAIRFGIRPLEFSAWREKAKQGK